MKFVDEQKEIEKEGNIVKHGCDGDVNNCLGVKLISNIMNKYNVYNDDIKKFEEQFKADKTKIISILNAFNHLWNKCHE